MTYQNQNVNSPSIPLPSDSSKSSAKFIPVSLTSFNFFPFLRNALSQDGYKNAETQIVEALTFEKTARFFLDSRRENGYEARAIDDLWGRLQKHIFPTLGARPLAEITAP